MTSVLFWLCAGAAAACWLLALTLGGLEVVQQSKGLSTEHTPRTLAFSALAPATLLSAFAYAAWRRGDGPTGQR